MGTRLHLRISEEPHSSPRPSWDPPGLRSMREKYTLAGPPAGHAGTEVGPVSGQPEVSPKSCVYVRFPPTVRARTWGTHRDSLVPVTTQIHLAPAPSGSVHVGNAARRFPAGGWGRGRPTETGRPAQRRNCPAWSGRTSSAGDEPGPPQKMSVVATPSLHMYQIGVVGLYSLDGRSARARAAWERVGEVFRGAVHAVSDEPL